MKPYAILIFVWLLLVYLLASLSSCTQMPQVSVPPKEVLPPTKAVLAWGDKHADWTAHVFSELSGKDFLAVTPADYKEWCEAFPLLSTKERAEFYAQLISIMAKRESGFNPASKYTESFDDAKGNKVISRGLMQISIESSNSYKCGFKDAQELHDPFKNLSCSIKIIERWVAEDKRLSGKVADKWRGVARYWSVMRSVSGSYPVVKDYVNKLPICL